MEIELSSVIPLQSLVQLHNLFGVQKRGTGLQPATEPSAKKGCCEAPPMIFDVTEKWLHISETGCQESEGAAALLPVCSEVGTS
jgi:hypothetical protein